MPVVANSPRLLELWNYTVGQKTRHQTPALNFTKILIENAGRSHVSFTAVTMEVKARMHVATAFFSAALTIELKLEFPTESNSEKKN